MKRSKKRIQIKIVSGGQTGVDRAALDAALELDFPCGGWCPRGRMAEDGAIPESYPLDELRSPSYAARTRLNVEDSDGTLVLCDQEPSGGTALTVDLALSSLKPLLVIKLKEKQGKLVRDTVAWLKANEIKILNVAGPRESGSPGIYARAGKFMKEVLEHI